MQKKVLNDLYRQGGVTSFVFPGETEITLEPLQNLALALNAGARFLVVDFSGRNSFKGNAPISANDLFEKLLDHATLDKLCNSEESWTITGTRCFPSNDDLFRNLYHNLQLLKGAIAQTVVILPQDINDQEAYYAKLISRLIVVDGESVAEASAFLEDLPHFNKANLLWLLPQKPDKKKFYHAYRAVRRSHSFFKEIRRCNWKKDASAFAKIIEQQHKFSILEKNPLGYNAGYRKEICNVCFRPDSRAVYLWAEGEPISMYSLNTGGEYSFYEDESVSSMPSVFSAMRHLRAIDKDSFVCLTSSGNFRFVIDYRYEFPGWTDWDEEARPYLERFLLFHPEWGEEDLYKLLKELQMRGLGFINSNCIKSKLEEISERCEKEFARRRKGRLPDMLTELGEVM